VNSFRLEEFKLGRIGERTQEVFAVQYFFLDPI
jgi:hypothetical protein